MDDDECCEGVVLEPVRMNYMDAVVIAFVLLRNLTSSVERAFDMAADASMAHANYVRERKRFASEGSREIERLISGD